MFKKKSLALIVSLVLVLTVSVGSTLAFLIAETDPVKNIFNPSKVTTEVVEKFENNVKTDVKIQNTGDTEAYIRAAVVVTWQNEAGEVYGTAPVAGTDYTIEYSLNTEQGAERWIKGADGFYYWTSPVAGYALDEDGNQIYSNTGVLITTASPIANRAPSGYYLCIEILGSGIQSLPTSVVASEWSNEKVTISVGDNGILNVTNNA